MKTFELIVAIVVVFGVLLTISNFFLSPMENSSDFESNENSLFFSNQPLKCNFDSYGNIVFGKGFVCYGDCDSICDCYETKQDSEETIDVDSNKPIGYLVEDNNGLSIDSNNYDFNNQFWDLNISDDDTNKSILEEESLEEVLLPGDLKIYDVNEPILPTAFFGLYSQEITITLLGLILIAFVIVGMVVITSQRSKGN
jgi:hypothetical protein